MQWKFKCGRCKRIWASSIETISVSCICHMDCEYCGKKQTVTTEVSRSGMNPKFPYDPQTHDPHPWVTTHGPCSNCVVSGSIVSGDYKPIEQYLVGDHVSTLDGNGAVTATFSRQYDGNLIMVGLVGAPSTLKVTPEHPILTVTKHMTRHPNPHRDDSNRHLSTPRWKRADELVLVSRYGGDYLMLPRHAGWIKDRVVSLVPFTSDHGRITAVAKHCPTSFPLTTETVWLLGLYAAEGFCGTSSIGFCLGKHETKLIEKASQIVSKVGYKANIRASRTGALIEVGSRLLARAFPAWLGRGASNKHVPPFILYHEDEALIQAFLDGYWAGDGYVVTDGVYEANTVSLTLALQLQILTARLGHHLTIFTQKQEPFGEIEGRRVNLRTKYRLRYRVRHGRGTRTILQRNHILVPIKSIRSEPYRGSVYNLGTSDGTYLLNNVVVHNCGHYQARPPVDALPMKASEIKFDEA